MSKLERQLAKLEGKRNSGEISEDIFQTANERLRTDAATLASDALPTTIWQEEEELAEAVRDAERGRSVGRPAVGEMPHVDPVIELIKMRANGEITAEEFAAAKQRLTLETQKQNEAGGQAALPLTAIEASAAQTAEHEAQAHCASPSSDINGVSDVEPQVSRRKGISKGWLIAVMIIGGLIAWGALNPRDPCKDTIRAFVMSQQFATDRLKSPSTAEFPSITDQGIQVLPQGECRFTVKSYVDAENGFGAKIRTRYIAEMSADKSGDKWQLTNFLFEPN